MATQRKPGPRTAAKIRPTPKPKVEEKPVVKKPKETATDREWMNSIREALLQRRAAITSVVKSNRNQLADNQGESADIADRASDGFEDELAAGLLSIETAQLEEINAALERIDKGAYGVCVNCQKPIPRKRLEVLPFAKRCLKCEGMKEQAARMAPPSTDEDESELD
ncbi:MAG: TraR/DksA C4-type zinc finger protein [Phycisphaerae bacterium]|nr:TraR/DksA C4-type zinc finger protein [Phycisphaerae bacterium]